MSYYGCPVPCPLGVTCLLVKVIGRRNRGGAVLCERMACVSQCSERCCRNVGGLLWNTVYERAGPSVCVALPMRLWTASRASRCKFVTVAQGMGSRGWEASLFTFVRLYMPPQPSQPPPGTTGGGATLHPSWSGLASPPPCAINAWSTQHFGYYCHAFGTVVLWCHLLGGIETGVSAEVWRGSECNLVLLCIFGPSEGNQSVPQIAHKRRLCPNNSRPHSLWCVCCLCRGGGGVQASLCSPRGWVIESLTLLLPGSSPVKYTCANCILGRGRVVLKSFSLLLRLHSVRMFHRMHHK